MNENILDDSVVLEESVSDDTVVEPSDKEYSADIVEFDVDSFDSVGSDTNVESVEVEDGTTVYYVDSSVQLQGLVDEELGGVPVVLMDDVSAVSDYVGSGGNSYQLPSYYVDYFSGVLANMSDTDYVAFAYRDYSYAGAYSSYVEHYILVYDVVVDSGLAVADTYPCIDICRESSSSTFSVVSSDYALSSVPAFSYGSFGQLSDLRKGVSHDEMWTVLFAIGFALVFVVLSRFFDCVSRLRRRTS